MEHTSARDENTGLEIRTYVADHFRATVEVDNGFGKVRDMSVDEKFRNSGIGTKAIKEIAQDFDSLLVAPYLRESMGLFARLGKRLDMTEVAAAFSKLSVGYYDRGCGIFEVRA